ncbi:MAG: phosphodiesterase [Rhodospirillales bacterium]|nr:phosphodiesterase [Rhodospirillales bacterium]
MIIAQISDPHIKTTGPVRGGIDSVAALQAALRSLDALDVQPDVLLVTGDLVNRDNPEDYAGLGAVLNGLPLPVRVIPGNHDDRALVRKTFGDGGYLPMEGPFLHYVVDEHPVRIVALDTVIPGEVGGAMCPERLEWLDNRLSEAPERPTLIAMHHPPFSTGIAYMDKHAFEGADAMANIVRRHPQVRRVICGHLHRYITADWAGTTAVTAPSLIFQMDLRLSDGASSAYILEPPGLLIHVWHPERGMSTHNALIGDFGPPQPFTKIVTGREHVSPSTHPR